MCNELVTTVQEASHGLGGSMLFSMVGVLPSLVQPLAEAGISVFAISTFDTDYVLVKAANLEQA